MITPITATFPALNFPKEVDYPTQEDWAAFSAAAELNYEILSGTWSDKSEEFKEQTNNLALEIQVIAENAFNAISLDTVEDISTYTGTGLAIVKDINRGGTFVSKTVIEVNPKTGSLYTIDDGTVFAKLGGGFWVRQYEGLLNVKWFNAKGDGTSDDTSAIQNALNIGDIFIPDGVYILSDKISHKTSEALFLDSGKIVNNSGRQIIGQSSAKTILKQSASFLGDCFIDLDGNSLGATDYLGGVYPYGQGKSKINNLTLLGRWVSHGDTTPVNGLRLRAVVNSSFSNIVIQGLYGDGLIFNGVTVANKDDVDTSLDNEFSLIIMYNLKNYGIKAVDNRIASTLFKCCSLRNCYDGGYIGGGAGIDFISCTFDSARTGYGALIKKTTTTAEPRGINFIGCMFEGNYKGEVFVDFANSVNVNGCVFHPYLDTTGTIWNEGSVIIKECKSATINGNRIQDYSINGFQSFIYGIVIQNTLTCLNVNATGNSFAKTTYRYSISNSVVSQPDITGATNRSDITNYYLDGISFNNDEVNRGANSLTYYQKGTFTITSGITGSYTANYQRVGNTVHFLIRVPSGSSITSATLSGLPFSATTNSPISMYADGIGSSIGANNIPNVVVSGTNVLLRKLDVTTGNYSNFTVPISPTGSIVLQGTYERGTF